MTRSEYLKSLWKKARPDHRTICEDQARFLIEKQYVKTKKFDEVCWQVYWARFIKK